MVHQRSQLKQLERDKSREQKKLGWTFIHSCRIEPDGTKTPNTWHDAIISETVVTVNPEIVIEHLETAFPMAVLPSVRQHFRDNVPQGLAFQNQYCIRV